MVHMRHSSLVRNKKVVLRSLAIGGAVFAFGRCALFFIQANGLLDVQVKDIHHPFILVDEKQNEGNHHQADIVLSEKQPSLFVAVERLKEKQPLDASNEENNDDSSNTNERREPKYQEDTVSKALNRNATGTNKNDTATNAKLTPARHETPDSKAKKDSQHGGTDTVERKIPSRKKHFHVVHESKKAKPKKAKPRTASTAKKRLPFYLHGMHKFLAGPHDPRKKLIHNLRTEKYKAIGSNVTTWALPITLEHPTRNHDSVILEGSGGPIMVTLLGRYSRYIQSMDLLSGKQTSVRTKGKDPSGNAIDDLNHVTAVVVDSWWQGDLVAVWLSQRYRQ
jgi:hypothetical protein